MAHTSEMVTKIIAFGIITALTIGATKVELVKLNYDVEGDENSNLNDEYVIIRNTSNRTLNLRKWKIVDEANHTLTLPKLKLKSSEKLKVLTGEGTNKLTGKIKKVYWNYKSAIWNNDHDVLIIKNRNGKVLLKYSY